MSAGTVSIKAAFLTNFLVPPKVTSNNFWQVQCFAQQVSKPTVHPKTKGTEKFIKRADDCTHNSCISRFSTTMFV